MAVGITLQPNFYGMKVRLSLKTGLLLFCATLFFVPVYAQFLVDMIDTTVTEEKGLWAIYRKTDHLQISGYFQPQFQVAQSKGAESYSGGDFSRFSDNRFMMRRGRIRFDYAHFNEDGLPQAQVVFQFDGTERGVVIRDFWGRIYENKWQLLSFTTGMFARPFGYEVNLSSGDRETPERGRMSQILLKTERDLGLMTTFEPRKKSSPFRLLKLDIGVFNGQGLAGPEEYDGFKDVIGRIYLKPYPVSNKVSISAGASMLHGGIAQGSRYVYRMDGRNTSKSFEVDSSVTNVGARGPRRYFGVDGQIRFKTGWGKTELRSEYWWGKQTGLANQSNTPGEVVSQPYYIRSFQGGFFYFLQDLASPRHQFLVKYDFYDPNRFVRGEEIGAAAGNTQAGDVKYHTLGTGYLFHWNTHIKIVLWYDMVKNERTSLDGFTRDVADNVFTCRVQYKF